MSKFPVSNYSQPNSNPNYYWQPDQSAVNIDTIHQHTARKIEEIQRWQKERNDIAYVAGEQIAKAAKQIHAALVKAGEALHEISDGLFAKLNSLKEVMAQLGNIPAVALAAELNPYEYTNKPKKIHLAKALENFGGAEISLEQALESPQAPFLSGVVFEAEDLIDSKLVKVAGKTYVVKAIEGPIAALHEEMLRKIGINSNLPQLHQVSVEIRPRNPFNLPAHKAPPLRDCIGYMREMVPFKSLLDEAAEIAKNILAENDGEIPDEWKEEYLEYAQDYEIFDEELIQINFMKQKLANELASELFAPHLQKMLRVNLLGISEFNPQNIFRDPNSPLGFSLPDVGFLATSIIQDMSEDGFAQVRPEDYFDLYQYTLSDEYKMLRNQKLEFIKNMESLGENSRLYKLHKEAFATSQQSLAQCYAEFHGRQFEEEEFLESFYTKYQTVKMHGNGEVFALEYNAKGKLVGKIDIVDSQASEEFYPEINEQNLADMQEAKRQNDHEISNPQDHFYFSYRKKYLPSKEPQTSIEIRGSEGFLQNQIKREL